MQNKRRNYNKAIYEKLVLLEIKIRRGILDVVQAAPNDGGELVCKPSICFSATLFHENFIKEHAHYDGNKFFPPIGENEGWFFIADHDKYSLTISKLLQPLKEEYFKERDNLYLQYVPPKVKIP